MRTQTTWAQAKYYLATDAPQQTMYQVATNITTDSHGQWTGGKLNYIKQYALPPDGSGNKTEWSPPNPLDPGYDSPEYKPVTTTGSTPQFVGIPVRC